MCDECAALRERIANLESLRWAVKHVGCSPPVEKKHPDIVRYDTSSGPECVTLYDISWE